MTTNLEAPFSVTEANNLFKTDFKEYVNDTYNTDVALYNLIDEVPMEGEFTEFPVSFGYKGGFSGTAPGTTNVANIGRARLTDKVLYVRAKVESRAIDLSKTSKGAFVKAMQEEIEKSTEMMEWGYSFCYFGASDGKAGTVKAAAGVTDNGGGSYTLIIGESASGWKEANFEERLFYNIGDGETDLFECTAVVPSTREVTFQRQAGGTKVPVESDNIYPEMLEDAAPTGLEAVSAANVGDSVYNITAGRRWVFEKDTAGGTISHAKINNLVSRNEKRVGKKNMANTAVTSYTQMAKLNNISESDKRYQPVKISGKGKFAKVVNFDGIQVLTSKGPINVIADKFCGEGDFYLLNTDKCKRHVAFSGWFTKDGTTFLRETDQDQMEARLVWRGENYIPPAYQARMSSLTL